MTANEAISIRRASGSDLPAIIELKRQSWTSAHWSNQYYGDLFSDAQQRLMLVAELPHAYLAGFLIARQIAPEWELENLLVATRARRTGIGKQLLEGLLAEVRATNGDSVFLEVRDSNTAARKFYEKMGFRETGRRKAYYSNPQEDAVLYQWTNA